MIYSCCDRRRLGVLETQSVYNGIAYLEVTDGECVLLVHLVLPPAPGALTVDTIAIAGGERIQNVAVISVTDPGLTSPAEDPRVVQVTVDQPGDYSTYTLTLVGPPPGFDPILSSIDFSFKVDCPNNFDCQPVTVCPSTPATPPSISYLAKDYASFLQLMLDRMAKVIPQWQEQSPADLGIAMIELLAYVGDYLSYQQDAVATEAYINTARKRTSLRRLVRLLDYAMNDGCNARVWVQIVVRDDIHGLVLSPSGTELLTRVGGVGQIIVAGSDAYAQAIAAGPHVFELLDAITLYAEHNRMSFYAWGDQQCCLPVGTTSAYLLGSFPNLVPGMVLVFEEVLGPDTGQPEDADPSHRQAVRLTSVTPMIDPIGGLFDTPPAATPVQVTAIAWSTADALTFPLCLSSLNGTAYYTDVSVASGNIVPADAGRTITGEMLPQVPAPNPALAVVPASSGNRCQPAPAVAQNARYRPALQQMPITFADPFDDTVPAATAMDTRALDAMMPAISLAAAGDPIPWLPQRDLLESHADSRELVVEVENDGTAYLRFGDGVLGFAPLAYAQFTATYRVGNGASDNIGIESLYHLVSADPAVVTDLVTPVVTNVRNPLPAVGGQDPETLDQVRQRAPYAFRTQERAVTADDYATMAQQSDSTIFRAAGTVRWTGSWRTVFIAADRVGGQAVDAPFKTALAQSMDYYRMAGVDVEIDTPVYVSLEIAMTVCAMPGYFASDVQRAILNVLSNRILPDGTRGAFYPDNFTFGQTVYLSPIIALAQATPGVQSVVVTTFQRQWIDSNDALDAGQLDLSRLEIARLDNDPSEPEHGTLSVTVLGGA